MSNRRERARLAQWRGEHRYLERRRLLLARGLARYQDEPLPNLRQAKVLAHVLDHYPVVVDEGDRLVGKFLSEPLSATEREELRAAGPLLASFQAGLRFGPGSGGVGGHRTIDFETLLAVGVRGLIRQVDQHAAQTADHRQAAFYEACRTVLQALLRFAERYRQRLLAMDQPELAALLQQVPAAPPRTFHEALQAAWLVQLAVGFDDPTCTGHPDRYLWPFYQADLAAGRLTRAAAQELVDELYLRSNEVYGDWPETILVGGSDRHGKLVHNDLTYLCIESIRRVDLINPNVALCLRDDTPDDLLDLCLEVVGGGCSHPAFYNDRVIVDGLVGAGLAVADARHYQNSTCVEITPVGCSDVQPAIARLYPAKTLELLLNGGHEMLVDQHFLPQEILPATWQRWTAPLDRGGLAADLGALTTFDELLQAYQLALRETVRVACEAAVQEEDRRAERGSCPLVSCFVGDCLERGLDVAQGGARYRAVGTVVPGFATTVDSLAAIRAVVYEQRCVDLPALAAALRADFVGHERLQRALLQAPKYGNADPAVDRLAQGLYQFLLDELARYQTQLGARFWLGVFSGWGGQIEGRRGSLHVTRGAVTAATPDGRRAGAPLSENTGPAPGAARTGAVSKALSIAQLDHRRGLGGLSVNYRFGREAFQSPAGRRRVAGFIRAALGQGLFQVQLNVVDTATLRAAQQSPAAYPNLRVRVAGYSEYFARLPHQQQEEVIARTEEAAG